MEKVMGRCEFCCGFSFRTSIGWDDLELHSQNVRLWGKIFIK